MEGERNGKGRGILVWRARVKEGAARRVSVRLKEGAVRRANAKVKEGAVMRGK